MTIQLYGIRPEASVGSCELPDDLRDAAREWADRKTMRLLDGGSLAPFVAISMVVGRSGLEDLSDVAVFTVSGWDPRVPEPPPGLDAEEMARHFYAPSNPTDWLRRMPNSALCQAAIVHGLRGSNLHLVGDGSSVELAFHLVASSVSSGAPWGIVCGYDPPGHQLHEPPDLVATRASAVLLSFDPEGAGRLLNAQAGRLAVDVLDEYVATNGVS